MLKRKQPKFCLETMENAIFSVSGNDEKKESQHRKRCGQISTFSRHGYLWHFRTKTRWEWANASV